MNTKRRRFLLILSLVLLVAASGSLNPAAASSVNVWGYDNNNGVGGLTFDLDVGTTDDSMSYSWYGNIAKGEASSTLGTVRLYAYAHFDYIDAHANISDTYTFTNLTNNDATGDVPGLCLRLTYSGVLSYGNGPVQFQMPGGWVNLTYNGTNYVIDTYTYNGGFHTISPSPNRTNAVSGEFIIPITAQYGMPTNISLNFLAEALTAGDGDSFADFYNTANFSFYADGISLGVTSEGGFNNVPRHVSLPFILLLLD
jgi:hypothetical protein